MAYVKSLPIRSHAHLNTLINYVLKEGKSSGLITTVDCLQETIAKDFSVIRKLAGKDKGILAHQIIQSFAKGETDVKTAHEITRQFAEKAFPGYQYMIVSHIDREHIHCHILLNSVNQITHEKYHSNKSSLAVLQKISDDLCRENNLSVIQARSGYKGLDKETYEIARQGRSWKVKLSNDLDDALENCNTKEEFVEFLEKIGYSINWTEKNISVIVGKYHIRLDTLARQFGEKYSKGAIEKALGLSVEPIAPIKIKESEPEYRNSEFAKIEKSGRSMFTHGEVEPLEQKPVLKNPYQVFGNIRKADLLAGYGDTATLQIRPSDVPKFAKMGIFYAGSISKRGASVSFKMEHSQLVAAVLKIDERKIKLAEEVSSEYKANKLFKEFRKALEETQHDKIVRMEIPIETAVNLVGSGVIYAGYRNCAIYNAVFLKEDLQEICRLTGLDYSRELKKIEERENKRIYRELKEEACGERLTYRVVDEEDLKLLKQSSLKFAYFPSDYSYGKYNIAMLDRSLRDYERIMEQENNEQGRTHRR